MRHSPPPLPVSYATGWIPENFSADALDWLVFGLTCCYLLYLHILMYFVLIPELPGLRLLGIHSIFAII